MNEDSFPVTAAILFAIGFYGLLSRTGLIHRLIAINIMSSAVFLLLVRVAVRPQGPHDPVPPDPVPPDPVPHAMVLTGIVVAISLTAFALALTRRFQHLTHRTHLAEDQEVIDADR